MALSQLSRWLRARLRRLGYEVRRSGPHGNPHVRRARILRHHGVDLVVDAGAHRGEYAGRLREYGYRGEILSIEPNPTAHAELARRAARDPRWQTRAIALGDHVGRARLSIARSTQASSLRRASPIAGALAAAFEVVDRVEVELTTLDAITAQLDSRCGTRMLKLDVQGSELDALRGAAECLATFRLVEIEVAPHAFYEGAANAERLLDHLHDAGFTLVSLHPNTIAPDSGHVLEYDAILVREIAPAP